MNLTYLLSILTPYLYVSPQVLDDWKFVARVMDRLLLILFLAVSLSGTLTMFLGAPHIFEFVDQDEMLGKFEAYTKNQDLLWEKDKPFLIAKGIVSN